MCMFKSDGACLVSSNVLLLTLQPNEGFSLNIDVKQPGAGFDLSRIPLDFKYADKFGDLPQAYETLLLDVLEGEQTLFVHGDEVVASWEMFDPLVKSNRIVHPYKAGTWGPKEAKRLSPPESVFWDKQDGK